LARAAAFVTSQTVTFFGLAALLFVVFFTAFLAAFFTAPAFFAALTFFADFLAMAAMDFFVVPTATFRLLYVLVVMTHERRKVVHFNITDSPTAAWTAQQMVNAFPHDTAPKYLLRDRDSIYGSAFVQRFEGMGIRQKLIAPRSPWQNPYVERLVGSIRRECLDRVIVFHERQLRQILESYLEYYHQLRPHRSLSHDSPIPRPVEPPDRGNVIELPQVGGLHHQYLRRAA